MAKRQELEDAYVRVAMEECDMEEELALSKAKNARLTPQKNKRLNAIHEAHVAVVSVGTAITEAEGKLAAPDSKPKPAMSPTSSSAPVGQCVV